MGKIAFVFPGQGAQAVGMGKDIYEHDADARAILDQANEALGFSLTDLMFNGPDAELKQTANTQPALLTTSIATLAVLKNHGCQPQVAAGHSLGEYTALVCAGVMSFVDAIKLVRLRGQYMQEAAAGTDGGMVAILGLDGPTVAELCMRA